MLCATHFNVVGLPDTVMHNGTDSLTYKTDTAGKNIWLNSKNIKFISWGVRGVWGVWGCGVIPGKYTDQNHFNADFHKNIFNFSKVATLVGKHDFLSWITKAQFP